ncbi:PAS domain S-box protein [Svornostia abyssi]|uniref:PAS domain S-box protein n=1 Tax=Svornostia abyssi TaxID=2898438 RepID=A0ABY5PLM7_9ACTN|nr:PAS domain S-box protein [Parviterribacteraceae bacterium J379]
MPRSQAGSPANTPGPADRDGPPAVAPGDPDIRVFWERATELFAVVGADGVFLRVNPAWTRVLGWREEELIGRSALEFVHPDDIALTRGAAVDTTPDGRALREMQNRYRHKDGSVRWLRWSGYEEGGRWYGVGRDVTATHTSHDALRASEQRSRAVLDALREGLLVVDRDLRVREANERFAEMVGLRVEEIVGLQPPYPWWPHDPQEQEAVLRAGMAALPVSTEAEFRHRTGATFPALVDSVELPQRSGHPAMLTVIRDITELVAARNRLIEVHETAELSSWEWYAADDRVVVHATALSDARESYVTDSENSMAGVIPEHRDALRRLREEVAAGVREGFKLDIRIVDDRPVDWIELRGRALRDGRGVVVGVRGSAQDITARKRAEAQARAEADLLRRLGTPVVAVDADLRVTYANDAAASRFGRSREDVAGAAVEPLLGEAAAALRHDDGSPRTGLVEAGEVTVAIDAPPPI